MRDLALIYVRGVLDRENAQIGALLTMHEPTQPMRAEAASAGFYHSSAWGTRHRRLQILPIKELLEGRTIDMPPVGQVSVTFQHRPRATRDGPQQTPSRQRFAGSVPIALRTPITSRKALP